MRNIIIAGCGTDVGKTVVSAIVTLAVDGTYWKPIESGPDSDSSIMQSLIGGHRIKKSTYSFLAPVSPHEAAERQGCRIEAGSIVPPQTLNPLIIEMAGGICTPLTMEATNLDLFSQWDAEWIIVSRHYLGSINHTLMTLFLLQQKKVSIKGLIFDGTNAASESAIIQRSGVHALGRLMPEPSIDQHIIARYAAQWKPFLL